MSASSPAPAATPRYDRFALGLHWAMAVLIVLAFGLALVVDVFPRSFEPAIVETHKDLGVAILVLLVIRFLWRLTHTPPAQDPEIGALAQKASHLGHLALYGLMVLVPVIGVLFAFWRGQGLHLGVVDIASPFAADRAVARPLKEIHELAAYALMGLAGLHAAAALWHHYVKRDSTLRRMLPA
ncbi:MAG: cytochrome b [Alsobacter sp.]